MNKQINVAFISQKIKEQFEYLKHGKFEDQQLYKFIDRAINDLKQDPTCGVKIPKKLWPKEYIKKYGINNLWKYDLPKGWRLLYTVQGNNVNIVSIIIEWMDHKNYERRFNY